MNNQSHLSFSSIQTFANITDKNAIFRTLTEPQLNCRSGMALGLAIEQPEPKSSHLLAGFGLENIRRLPDKIHTLLNSSQVRVGAGSGGYIARSRTFSPAH